MNYDKTKGLWVGKWKSRRDEPLSIPWTNGNVKTLGVYFGNDNPARQTFTELLPKVLTSMNFWKQFRSSKLAKARVVEIFHASRLWYAARFYSIPPPPPPPPTNHRKGATEGFFLTILITHTKRSR